MPTSPVRGQDRSSIIIPDFRLQVFVQRAWYITTRPLQLSFLPPGPPYQKLLCIVLGSDHFAGFVMVVASGGGDTRA
jgi:hypothetical protein